MHVKRVQPMNTLTKYQVDIFEIDAVLPVNGQVKPDAFHVT